MPYETIPIVVELYEHDDYKGKKLVVIESVKTLADFGFNDNVSSIKVFKGPNYQSGKKVILHRDRDFKGGSVMLDADKNIPSLRNAANFNDVASSIELV